MKKNMIKAVVLAAFAVVTGYNVHEAQTKVELSDTQMKNVEALATGEGGNCTEWVDKKCYSDEELGTKIGSDFYARCSGTPTVTGGKLECGSMSIYEPIVPCSGYYCLYCVR